MINYKLSQWAGKNLIATSIQEIYNMGEYNVTPKTFAHSFSDTKLNIDINQNGYGFDNVMHAHDDFMEIFYVHHGCGVAFLNGTKQLIQKGDIVCVYPGEVHVNYPLPEIVVYNCLISSSLIHHGGMLFEKSIGEDNQFKLAHFNRFRGEILFEIGDIFNSMLREYSKKPLFFEDYMISCVNRLLICMYRFQLEDKSQINYQLIMAPLLDYISDHYETVTLSQLADYSSYNLSYLSRLFRNTFGITFTEYVNRLRIEQAVKFITETKMSIEDICTSVGFRNRMHFYEIFKRYTGFTPGDLRKIRSGQSIL